MPGLCIPPSGDKLNTLVEPTLIEDGKELSVDLGLKRIERRLLSTWIFRLVMGAWIHDRFLDSRWIIINHHEPL